MRNALLSFFLSVGALVVATQSQAQEPSDSLTKLAFSISADTTVAMPADAPDRAQLRCAPNSMWSRKSDDAHVLYRDDCQNMNRAPAAPETSTSKVVRYFDLRAGRKIAVLVELNSDNGVNECYYWLNEGLANTGFSNDKFGPRTQYDCPSPPPKVAALLQGIVGP